MSIKNTISTLTLGFALLLALACGGGSSSSAETSSDQATLRLAGGKAGDTVQLCKLDGTEVTSTTFGSTGTVALKVSVDYSLHLYVKVSGKSAEKISLFETLVSSSDLKAALAAKKALDISINSATTVVTQAISSSDLSGIYSIELAAATASTSSSNVKKPREATTYTTLASLLSSVYGVSTITNLELTNIATSTNGNLANLSAKVKRHAFLTAIALRSADEGTLSLAGWTAVLAASAAVDTSASALDGAQALATAIKTYMPTKTALTVSDFGTELALYLGSGTEVQNMISSLQSGDISGILSFVQSSSSVWTSIDYNGLGWTALTNNNVLTAFKYFSAGNVGTSANNQVLAMSAITRLITMGLKDAAPIKAFQKAVNVEYTFVDNAKLEGLLNDGQLSLETKTNYASPDKLTGFATIDELIAYVKDGLMVDVDAALADLDRITNVDGFQMTIPAASQGKNSNNVALATSPIELDGVDIKALQASLLLAKAKAQYFLGHNLKVTGANDTRANSLSAIYDAASNVMFTGSKTLNATWLFESGSISSHVLSGANLTVKGHYPGMLLLDGKLDNKGHQITFEIRPWDNNKGDEKYLISKHAAIYASQSYAYYFQSSFDSTMTGSLLHYRFTGGIKSLTGNWDYTIELSSNTTFGVFHATYAPTSNSSNLTLTTRRDIDDTRVASAINNNTSFLNITQSYLTSSRLNVQASSEKAKSVLDTIKVLNKVTTPRLNHLIETPTFEFKNKTVLKSTQINGVEIFIGSLVDALFGSASVNPTVFHPELKTSNVDLSAVFTKNSRDLMVDGNNQAFFVSGNLRGDEVEADATLDAAVTNKTVFGIPASKYADNKTASAVHAFGNVIQDWGKDGISKMPTSGNVYP